MKQVLIQLYEFNELCDEAKEKILKEYRDINTWDFSERFSQYLKEYLEERGLPSKDVAFSLGYCQGDGVAFYGQVDLYKYLSFYKLKTRYKPLKNLICGEISIWIEKNSFGYHYSHSNTMRVYDEAYTDLTIKQDGLLSELIKEIKGTIGEESKKLEKIGYDWIEEDESDEAVEETIEINEFKFFKSGTTFTEAI